MKAVAREPVATTGTALAERAPANGHDLGNERNPVWDALARQPVVVGDHGNRAEGPPRPVQRHTDARGGGVVQRMGEECGGCEDEEEEEAAGAQPVQTKLTVGPPDDQFEREADTVADTVMRSPLDGPVPVSAGRAWRPTITPVQCKCDPCASEADETVRRKGDGAAPHPGLGSVRRTIESPGRGVALSARVRKRVEPVLGADLSGVRVHHDSRARRAAASIRARAFTHGSHIFLGANQSPENVSLMAHEATHVLQQTAPAAGAVQRQLVQRDPAGAGTAAPAPTARRSCDINEANPIIWFDYDSTNIRTSGGVNSTVHLMLAVRRAQEHIAAAGPSARIYIYGYASEEGDDDHNRDLSRRRAVAIKGLLEAAGIDPANLVAVGLGEDTSMGSLALNRRVEICPTPTITYITMPEETVTADAMDCALPTTATNLTQYAFLVSCLEAHLASTHGPLDILRTLRELYYGSGLFDAAACGERESGTVARLAATARPLHRALVGSQDTTGVDVGHIFTGLEGMLCPRTSTSPAWWAPSVRMANEDFLTWGGDIGSAAAGRLEGYHASGWIFKTHPPWRRYFLTPRTLASREDLLGDIDAFSMRANATGFACSATKGTRMPSPTRRISSMLLDFYSAPPGMAAGLTSADRYRCFAEAVGARIVGTSIANIPVLVNRYAPQVYSFAHMFYLNRNRSAILTWDAGDTLVLYSYSREITRMFFDWIDANL